MSVLKPRNRLVNFRLSDEEFAAMNTACEKSGARSLSDFARGAVLYAVEQADRGVRVTAEAGAPPLDGMISHLERRIEQILRLLDGVEGRAAMPADEANVPVRQ
jgi:hypothetical protein